MRILGNIVWLVFGGLISAIGWWCAGILWCVTVIGIPVGVQCFKLSSISLNPFGKEIENDGGAGAFLLNILWLVISGWELALGNAIIGCLFCITIVGIPFGKQFFKIAKVALMPFGTTVRRVHFA